MSYVHKPQFGTRVALAEATFIKKTKTKLVAGLKGSIVGMWSGANAYLGIQCGTYYVIRWDNGETNEDNGETNDVEEELLRYAN